MQSEVLSSIRRLSDDELVARVRDLVTGERGSLVQIVAHLAELDTRDVHYRLGHGSLFAYCRDVLGLSEQEAYNRICVARAARRFPAVLQLLEDGTIHLTTARLLAPHLTPDNHAGVLEKARGKSKAQVEELAAALWPRADVPSFVRKLPAPRPALAPGSPPAPDRELGSANPPLVATTVDHRPATASTAPGLPVEPRLPQPLASDELRRRLAAAGHPALSAAPLPRAAEVTPLAPDRYKMQVTIGSETLEKLRLAKDLLRHAVPSGDEAVILDRALTALLADLAQTRFAATEKPRPTAAPPRPGSRTIPAEIKRRVWVRDLGRCAFVAPTGRRCAERAFLEFHHLKPFALGGEATFANIQLRCRNHNAYEARLWFGSETGNGGAGCVREAGTRYRLRSPGTGGPALGRGEGGGSAPVARARSGTSPVRTSRSGPSLSNGPAP